MRAGLIGLLTAGLTIASAPASARSAMRSARCSATNCRFRRREPRGNRGHNRRRRGALVSCCAIAERHGGDAGRGS